MLGEAKNIPPTKSRRVAAARAGLLAGGELLSFGAILLVAAFAMHLWGQRLLFEVRDFAQLGIRRVSEQADPISATTHALKQGGVFLAVFLGAALAVILAVNLSVALRQLAGVGRTAVPIPHFRPSRAAILVIRGFAACVLALALLRTGGHVLAALSGPTQDVAGTVLRASTTLVATAGVIFAVAGAAQFLCEQIAIWRALHLSPSDHKRETRDAAGDPRFKAALRRRYTRGGP